MKPIETGVGHDGPADALALRAAAGVDDPIECICPQRFALPAAPTVAAAAEDRDVDLEAVRSAFVRLAARYPMLVVEGAGGLLAPAAKGTCMGDLAAELRLPLLIVSRAVLGTINHTLLTLEAAARRDLPLAGVVISHGNGRLAAADEANLAALRRELGDRLVGEIPPLAPGAFPAQGDLDHQTLLKRLG